MRKSHVALATLGLLFTGAAYAQSSVILYGVADANLEFATHGGAVPLSSNQFNPGQGNNAYRMDSGGLSGSRWGLRGTEDLGADLKSVFVLESGFGLDTGASQQSGRLFGRQAFVGLQSARYGQLTFGRQYTSLFDALANFSPTKYSTQYEPIVMQAGANYREDNTVKYSGTFGPVTLGAHWSFGTGLTLPQVTANGTAMGGSGEVPGQFRRDSAYGVGAVYGGGPLGVAIAYDQFNPTIGVGSGTVKKAAVAASYAFGPVQVMGGYRWGQNKDQNGSLTQRDDYYWLGASYQLTPAIGLTLEYSYENLKNLSGDMHLANPWQLAFISNYAFSKRTDIYLTTAFAKNAGLMLDSPATGYANSLALGTSYALANGQSTMLGVAAGIRHKF